MGVGGRKGVSVSFKTFEKQCWKTRFGEPVSENPTAQKPCCVKVVPIPPLPLPLFPPSPLPHFPPSPHPPYIGLDSGAYSTGRDQLKYEAAKKTQVHNSMWLRQLHNNPHRFTRPITLACHGSARLCQSCRPHRDRTTSPHTHTQTTQGI